MSILAGNFLKTNQLSFIRWRQDMALIRRIFTSPQPLAASGAEQRLYEAALPGRGYYVNLHVLRQEILNSDAEI